MASGNPDDSNNDEDDFMRSFREKWESRFRPGFRMETPVSDIIKACFMRDGLSLQGILQRFHFPRVELSLGLLIAAEYGVADCLRLLLQAGVDVNDNTVVKLVNGNALTQTCRHGYVECVRMLLEAGVDVNFSGCYPSGDTPLMVAAVGGHMHCLELLLSHPDIKVNERNNAGATAFIKAAETGRTDAVVMLSRTPGVDLCATDNNGKTALALAAVCNHPVTLRTLLNMKVIDVNAVDLNGRSALFDTLENANDKCAKYLIETYTTDIDMVDNNGYTILDSACNCGNPYIVQTLLEKGIAFTQSPNADRTAAMSMSCLGHHTLLRKILDSGAVSVTHLDPLNRNALYFAAANGNPECLEMLIDLVPEGKKHDKGMKKMFLRSGKLMYTFLNLPILFERGIFHWHWYPEYYYRSRRSLVKKMIVHGVAPGLFPFNDRLSTPLQHAFLVNDFGLAKYILANFYLTAFDLSHFQNNQFLSREVILHGMPKIKRLFNKVTSTPWRLETLALIKASSLMPTYLKRSMIVEKFKMDQMIPAGPLQTLSFERAVRWSDIYEWDKLHVSEDLNINQWTRGVDCILMPHVIYNNQTTRYLSPPPGFRFGEDPILNQMAAFNDLIDVNGDNNDNHDHHGGFGVAGQDQDAQHAQAANFDDFDAFDPDDEIPDVLNDIMGDDSDTDQDQHVDAIDDMIDIECKRTPHLSIYIHWS